MHIVLVINVEFYFRDVTVLLPWSWGKRCIRRLMLVVRDVITNVQRDCERSMCNQESCKCRAASVHRRTSFIVKLPRACSPSVEEDRWVRRTQIL